MIVEILVFGLTLFLIATYLKGNKNKNLPPGPWEVPFLGRPPIMSIKGIEENRRKYGKIFMTRTGVMNFIYITDYHLAKETHSKIEFADRPKWSLFHCFEEEQKNETSGGIIFRNGQTWHTSRRFLLRQLRDLGMGTSKIEDIMMREVENLVEDFKGLTDKPSKLSFSINVAILNVIWQLVAGHRYEFDDSKVHSFMAKLRELQDGFISGGLPDFFPFLKYIPNQILDYVLKTRELQKAVAGFVELVQPFIDEHLEKLDCENPADLMDEYLIEMTTKRSPEFSHFSVDDLRRTTFDLFVAGNDTTSNMTHWILLYMAKFPHIQRKVQDEIDKFVPHDQLPTLQHRPNLVYLDATINEVQRHASLISFGVFRSCQSDQIVSGYHIPKDSTIFSIAGVTHKDPTLWENADEFDPTRFLDSNGKFIPTCDGFQPFGIGKRQCLGENFARMELFLIAGALLKTFTFGPPEGGEIDVTPKNAFQQNLPNTEHLFSIKLRHSEK